MQSNWKKRPCFTISFQVDFQKRWQYQIIYFVLSIVSPDGAKITHASNCDLTFDLF